LGGRVAPVNRPAHRSTHSGTGFRDPAFAGRGPPVSGQLEGEDGRVVGLEVKAAASVGTPDIKGLEALREVAGKRFHRGIVLYAGREALPIGAGLWALPLSAVWRIQPPGGKRRERASE
jgi:hypothetical protein